MINLELPKKIQDTRALLRQFSRDGLRPLSRKYDLLEQKEMPEELYDLVKLLRGGRSQAEKSAETLNSASFLLSSLQYCKISN